MDSSTRAAHLQHQIEAQLELAALATNDTIRAMHEDLEKLYRTQRVALLVGERLAERAEAGRFAERSPTRMPELRA